MHTQSTLRLSAAICALALLCPLSACAKQPAAPTADAPSDIVVVVQPAATIAPASTAAPAATAAPTAAAAPTDSTTDGVKENARAAYRTALENLLQNHILPDGTDAGFDEAADASGNQFAILDVDGDGSEELVVLYTTTYMAGQTAGIYAFDAATRSLRAELTEYPLFTFFDNGVIQAGWSHNQGLAGSFWPYTLYAYDASADSYQAVGMADAWEKAFAPSDFQGNPFPDALDESGAGIVYYLIPGGVYQEVAPVSAGQYEAWRTEYLGDAAEVTLPFTALTSEAVAAIQ